MNDETPLEIKIDRILSEAKIILPGVQVLFGFQLSIIFLESFASLPANLKYLHFVSICFIAVCTILLITPAAYHRIVERGEDSEQFHRFGTKMMLLAMITLAFGISIDFVLVAWKVSQSLLFAIILSGLLFILYCWLWFFNNLLLRFKHT